MATEAPYAVAAAAAARPPAITSVKHLSETANLTSIPSYYIHSTNPTNTIASDPHKSIPTVDLSLLTSHNPGKKSEAIENLDKACREWGFFMVVNHGIPEELMKAIIDATNEFFNLPDDEKPEFEPKNVLSPIRYGTSFNTAKEQVFCWRDFLKVFLHPEFYCPNKPNALRELLLQYCERTGDVFRKLVRGMSRGLGLEEDEMEKALDLEKALRIFAANLYPPCPNPDMALGLVPHSDHGLLTLLIQNEISGLQIQHEGKWINVHPLPNSILVNTSDQLEVFSNGRYKSVLHRAIVNNQRTRISIAMVNGPSTETVVAPVQTQGTRPLYVAMKYKDYLLAQQSYQLNGKSILYRFGKIEESQE